MIHNLITELNANNKLRKKEDTYVAMCTNLLKRKNYTVWKLLME
jgi:hypothetical protein